MVKSLSTNAGDVKDAGLISGSGRCLEEKMATHSSSGQDNPMGRGACALLSVVAES